MAGSRYQMRRRSRGALSVAGLALLALWFHFSGSRRPVGTPPTPLAAHADVQVRGDVLHFHAVGRSSADPAALVQALAGYTLTEHACVLHVHLRASTALPHDVARVAGAAEQCSVVLSRMKTGASWADVPLSDMGVDVLVRVGAPIHDDTVQWLMRAKDAVLEHEKKGARRDIAAAVVPCDTGDGICAVAPTHGELWGHFKAWRAMHRGEWNLWPQIADEFEETPQFWRGRSNKKRDAKLSKVGSLVGRRYEDPADIWERWFNRWARNYSLNAVKRTSDVIRLEGIWKEDDDGYMAALRDVVMQGAERIALTIVDSAFLELTMAWLCNVQTAGFLPHHVVWLTLDDHVRNALDETGVGVTVDLSSALRGKGNEMPEILYGHKTYWKLMLLRTKLIRDLLVRGIDVFLFETDQVWLQDPLLYIQKEIEEGADMVGTIDTQHNIAGNTLLLRAVLPTRRLWAEVYSRFKSSYLAHRVDDMHEEDRVFVEHDQYSLSDLLLYNHRFKADFPVALGLMNADLFVGGSWYSGLYSSEASKRPVIINNNFVSGVSKKRKRAIEFGHWFLDRNGVCDPESVRKALRYETIMPVAATDQT